MCSCPQWEAPRRRTYGWFAAKGMWALGVPLSEEMQDGEETLWWSCRRKLGWVDPFVPLGSVLSLQCHTWCAVPPSTGSKLQRQQLPHSAGAQPSDSSSLKFIQYIHSPKAMYCACVWGYRGVWDILTCHKTCTLSSRGNACFLNGSKPWKSTDVFVQFRSWALMTLPCRNLQPG